MSAKSVTIPVSARISEVEKRQIDEIVISKGYSNMADFIKAAIRDKIKSEAA